MDHRKNKRVPEKNIYFCFIGYAKAFDCVDHNKLWKFLKRWEYQTTWPASWEICMQAKKQQLELNMELQSLLVEVKEESEKAGLKLSIKKTKIMASSPSLHGK